MPDPREFDIYQTASGYSAVTNVVRRKILEALKDGERDLPFLVKATGKSKPTLSNLHMRELLEQRLIEELAHPTDARRKLYRLAARRIGSSDVPLDQLRGAVKHYVTLSPLAYAVPLPTVLSIVAADGVDKRSLRAMGRELGEQSATLFTAATERDVLTALAAFWEREGIAKTQKLDFDSMQLEIEIGERTSKGRDAALAVVLAGVVEGILASRLKLDASVEGRVTRGRRVTLRVDGSKASGA